jgi:Secretion system C-terminal sorting domain
LLFLLRHSAIPHAENTSYFDAAMKNGDGVTAKHLCLKLKIISRLVLFSALFFHFFIAHSQTTNISGIVNSYYKVVEIIPAKAGIRVANITGLNMNDKVMIIQMKGATVKTTNTTTFGDTTGLNNAGNYEIGTICTIRGDTAFLFFNLVNQYTVSEKVQLVKFAEYYSANVVDTIKAASWSNTSGTGGVIAISVDEDLTLNAPVYADSAGYKGGSSILSTGGLCLPAPDYTYDPGSTNPQNGATKGEGAANIASNLNGGRGAPANGGGGGNYHNNGGGGGANLAAGGNGGGNSSFVGCQGNFKGLGGKALSNWSGTKIFPGGGGGAGHFNNNTPTYGGGNGGGIVFITTKNLIGNGYKITANGQTGGSNISDGASGGGAGGTIIMDILNLYSGSVIIQTNGGSGGNANDGLSSGRCYGAGGGGSAGVIYFTGATPAVTVNTNGGNAGLEISSDPGCTLILPSAGSNGSVIPNYSYIRSTSPAGYCATLLPVKFLYFKVTANQNKAWLQWKIANPELIRNFVIERFDNTNGWETLNDLAASSETEEYHFIDNGTIPGTNQYRLKIIEKNNQFFYSTIQKVFININNEFDIYPNPTTGLLNITGDFSSLTTIELADLSGKLIWQKKLFSSSNIVRMDLAPLSPGIYMMRINKSLKKLVIR